MQGKKLLLIMMIVVISVCLGSCGNDSTPDTNVTSETTTIELYMEDIKERTAGAAFTDGRFLTWKELKLEVNGRKYQYDEELINNDAIKKETFLHNGKIMSLILPDEMTVVEDEACSYARSLSNVSLGNGTKKIGKKAFLSSGLSRIRLNEGLEEIDDYAFSICSKLTEVELPSTLKKIGRHAFYGTRLTEIIIPEGVTSIGEEAFGKCVNLECITLPSTLEFMGNDENKSNYSIIGEIPSLKTVKYNGTAEEFKKIEGAEYFLKNESAYLKEVECTDEKIIIRRFSDGPELVGLDEYVDNGQHDAEGNWIGDYYEEEYYEPTTEEHHTQNNANNNPGDVHYSEEEIQEWTTAWNP